MMMFVAMEFCALEKVVLEPKIRASVWLLLTFRKFLQVPCWRYDEEGEGH